MEIELLRRLSYHYTVVKTICIKDSGIADDKADEVVHAIESAIGRKFCCALDEIENGILVTAGFYAIVVEKNASFYDSYEANSPWKYIRCHINDIDALHRSKYILDVIMSVIDAGFKVLVGSMDNQCIVIESLEKLLIEFELTGKVALATAVM